MAKIIDFPNKIKSIGNIDVIPTKSSLKITTIVFNIFVYLIKIVWVITALMFPLLKWIISLDCVIQFIRMMYYWEDKSVHAGMTFLLHFSVLIALTIFVTVYKPKDF